MAPRNDSVLRLRVCFKLVTITCPVWVMEHARLEIGSTVYCTMRHAVAEEAREKDRRSHKL